MKPQLIETTESREIMPGFLGRAIHSERMTFMYWEIAAGAELPEHSHLHEQVAHVFEGEFEITIDGETLRLLPGTVTTIPSGAVHSGRAITACKIMDAFAPVREDYR